MLTKDTAICISAIDYSETSQIVTLFTSQTGKISVIAKGSKRLKSAFSGTIEVFSYGRIVFTSTGGEKLAKLTEFEQQPLLIRADKNLFNLNCALFAAELINQLIDEYDPHPELFDHFQQFIQNMANALKKIDALALLILFQLALLKEIGLQPVLNACVNCKRNFSSGWHQSYFSSFANGLICRDCEASFVDKIMLTNAAADCLMNLKMIANANEKTLTDIEKILVYHFTEITGRQPKMAKYIY